MQVPRIVNAGITRVEEVGDELHVTVAITYDNATSQTLYGQYPDYATTRIWILNPACPVMAAEPLFYRGFARDIPPGANTLEFILAEKIIYLTGYRTTPIGPGATPVILGIRLEMLGWVGSPYNAAEFADSLLWSVVDGVVYAFTVSSPSVSPA